MAVSVDPPEQAKQLVRKLDLKFPILCDTKRELIRTLGLAHEGGCPDELDVPVPAHFLLDRSGKVLWRYRSKMVQDRPDPRDIVDVIEHAAFGTRDSLNHAP